MLALITRTPLPAISDDNLILIRFELEAVAKPQAGGQVDMSPALAVKSDKKLGSALSLAEL